MQKKLRLIAGLIVARYECTYVQHCKENAPIYMYYVAPETPMMSSVIADCPDLAPPNIWDKSTPMHRRIGKFKAGTSESPGGPQISNTSASHVIRECQAAFQYRILTVEMLGPKLWLQ